MTSASFSLNTALSRVPPPVSAGLSHPAPPSAAPSPAGDQPAAPGACLGPCHHPLHLSRPSDTTRPLSRSRAKAAHLLSPFPPASQCQARQAAARLLVVATSVRVCSQARRYLGWRVKTQPTAFSCWICSCSSPEKEHPRNAPEHSSALLPPPAGEIPLSKGRGGSYLPRKTLVQRGQLTLWLVLAAQGAGGRAASQNPPQPAPMPSTDKLGSNHSPVLLP